LYPVKQKTEQIEQAVHFTRMVFPMPNLCSRLYPRCFKTLFPVPSVKYSIFFECWIFVSRNLSRFAHKTPKNRRLGDFLPCKLRRTKGTQEPINRDFLHIYAKNPQVRQAPRQPSLSG
jgi:hypothetical protein